MSNADATANITADTSPASLRSTASSVSAAVDGLESEVRSLCAARGFTESDLHVVLGEPAAFFAAAAALRYGALAHNTATLQSLQLAVSELGACG
jgi:hypothetical protein